MHAGAEVWGSLPNFLKQGWPFVHSQAEMAMLAKVKD